MPKRSTTNEDPRIKIDDKKMPKKRRNNRKKYDIEEFSEEIGNQIISNKTGMDALKKLKGKK